MVGVPALGLESRPHMETAGRQRIPDHHRRGGSLYLYQAAYTAESVAAQIKEPQDRIKAVTPALQAQGSEIVVGVTHSASMTCWPSSRHPMTRRRPASRWLLPPTGPPVRPRRPGPCTARRGW